MIRVAILAALLATLPGPRGTTVEGPDPGASRVLAAMPAAIARVEERLGPVDWSGIEVHATSYAATRQSRAPEWAAGYASPGSGRVVLRLDRIGSYPHSTLDQVLAHEIAHVALARRGADDLPRWFEEGLCMSIARERGAADIFELTTTLVLGGPSDLAELDLLFHGGQSDAQSGYALARELVGAIEAASGQGATARIVAAVAAGTGFDRAVLDVTGSSPDEVLAQWRRQAVRLYRWLPILTSTVTLWTGITLLVLLAGARKRRLVRELRNRWALEDGELTEEDTSGPNGPH
jgi:hypothetical protein